MGKQKKSAGPTQGSKSAKREQSDELFSKKIKREDMLYYGTLLFIAAAVGIYHSSHISNMFEKQRFFSHLSTLERELSFRTEMGLYYSYYKTIAEAPTFGQGLQSIVQCNLTEYPDTVNVLRRFNLQPELILGASFRVFDWFTKLNKIRTKDCYQINRGQGMPPVESCEGMGDIAFFYVYPIFWLNGLMMSVLFILGAYLSDNLLGGFLVVLSYFFNHGEATRVMWTPPLRESFSFPFLIMQILALTFILRSKRPSWKHGCLLSVVTLCFMLPWQFAQFALLTQCCALFGLYILKFIDAKKVSVITSGLLVAHGFNILFQCGNTLLISSFFMAAAVSLLLIAKLEPHIEKLPNRILIWAVQVGLFIVCSLVIKVGSAKVFQIEDDAHIFAILKSKFSTYKDFHTLLYVCAPEFDFIEAEYFYKLSKTLLIPTALVVAIVAACKILYNEFLYWVKGAELGKVSEGESPTKPHTEAFYVLLQAIAYMLMTFILMRMKLFGTPGLCILTAFLANRQLFGFVGKKSVHYGIVVAVIAGMTFNGLQNLQTQWAMKGEYNNPEQEQLIEWINHHTEPDAVFAGSMPTMANVKLSTLRPIVMHPHYEDAGLRARVKRVYQMFSRKPVNHVYNELKDMKVQYVVVDSAWCNRQTSNGCAISEVFDNEDIENRGKPPTCAVLEQRAWPFTKVYKNKMYTVFKL